MICRVIPCRIGEGGVQRWTHADSDMAMISPTLWHWECRLIVLYELHNFVNGFIVGISLDIGEHFDSELVCAIVNRSWIGHHIGHRVLHIAVST